MIGATFLCSLLSTLTNATFGMFYSKIFVYHYPFFSATMSRNRFQSILRYLHLVDNSYTNDLFTPQDPLRKIWPFVDTLCSTFKGFYYPEKEPSLEGNTCPFKGWLGFVTYNPNKPNKWGDQIVSAV